MALAQLLERPVQPRHESDDEQIAYNEASGSEDDRSSDEGDTSNSEAESSNDSVTDAGEEQDTSEDDLNGNDLKDISFGALAKAQETFAPQINSRKRKASTLSEDQPISNSYVPDPSTRKDKDSRPNQPVHRTSKHAPTILSSKHPVSRKRPQIFEPSPALKSRDPRFDPTVTSSTLNQQSSETVNKNYAFLSNYQATEILNLKSQIKKSKDPTAIADLKAQVMSMESRIRNAQNQQKEREILRSHKQAEKEAIREGKKSRPYFLKKSDIKSKIEKERLEGMGKKARDLMEKRKLKRVKGKEKRDMPGIMVRRSYEA